MFRVTVLILAMAAVSLAQIVTGSIAGTVQDRVRSLSQEPRSR